MTGISEYYNQDDYDMTDLYQDPIHILAVTKVLPLSSTQGQKAESSKTTFSRSCWTALLFFFFLFSCMCRPFRSDVTICWGCRTGGDLPSEEAHEKNNKAGKD
jgi:hypothetical protein